MDNVERLARLLYGRDAKIPEILGGSDAKIIADACAEIEQLTKERDRQYDYNVEQIAKQAALEAEIEQQRELICTALTGEHGFCAVSRGWIYSEYQACTRCDAMEVLEKIAKESLPTKDRCLYPRCDCPDVNLCDKNPYSRKSSA